MIDERKLIEERPEYLNPNQVGKEEYNKGWNDCNNKWFDIVESQPKVGEWIPCSERLPEKQMFEKGYIVQEKNVIEPHSAWWDGEVWTDVNDERIKNVIAWMPLPEPYKGED